MSIDDEALARLRSKLVTLPPGREADPRYVVTVSYTELSALLDIAEAVARAPVGRIDIGRHAAE